MMARYNQRAQDCDDMFIRHLGIFEFSENKRRKSLFNPFADFAEGVKLVITFPIILLKWYDFVSEDKVVKLKRLLQ